MNSTSPLPVVLAITGASGSAYAVRLMQVLLQQENPVHLIISDAAREVARRELNSDFPANDAAPEIWLDFLNQVLLTGRASGWGFATNHVSESCRLFVHTQKNYSAGIASGSFLTRGMVICPCSMGTLSSIACGASTNLIQRAADVHLKERRTLVLVPRETPLGLIALQNMTTLTTAGATIMPAAPGLYHQPTTLADIVDFVVARICDHLKIPHSLMNRWGTDD